MATQKWRWWLKCQKYSENIMYFPIGWPKYLKETQHDSPPLQYIISSCDRMLFAILCEDTISIWYCKVKTLVKNMVQIVHNWQIHLVVLFSSTHLWSWVVARNFTHVSFFHIQLSLHRWQSRLWFYFLTDYPLN